MPRGLIESEAFAAYKARPKAYALLKAVRVYRAMIYNIHGKVESATYHPTFSEAKDTLSKAGFSRLTNQDWLGRRSRVQILNIPAEREA
jgi:hypothetical protein